MIFYYCYSFPNSVLSSKKTIFLKSVSKLMSVSLKVCNNNHIALLSKVATKAYNNHYVYLWNDDGKEYACANFNQKQFKKEIEHPNSLFYLIYLDEKAVGFLKLNINKAFQSFSDQEALELERIYLFKEITGKGIGTFIMNFVVDLAKEKHKTIVWLKSMESSESLFFYQKNGFEIVGKDRLNFHQMKQEFRTILSLIKIL